MDNFKKYLSEQKLDGGDCFQVANRVILDKLPISDTQDKDYKIVHALVHGQGGLAGRRFVHAFILFDDKIVMDQSNGLDLHMMKSRYYKLGKIDTKERGAYKEYTIDQARERMLAIGTHGPWDIDTSLEEKFDRMSRQSLKITSKDMKKLKEKNDE